MLEYVALFLIFSLPVLVAAQIVVFGALPGKIARKRGHPWPEAVNVAGWIGMVTGVFWPVALIWAFLPIPQRVKESADGTTQPSADANDLAARVASLEATVNKLAVEGGHGMITVLLMFCYLGCVLVAFKVIKIKVNPVSVTVATLISVCLLGGVVIGWTMAAPMTGQMTLRRRVLQVVPDVKELVSKVYVKPDQKIKKGDPLFEIRPDRFQDTVDAAKAQLTAANATVSQLEAGGTAAQAAVKKSEADTAAAKAEFDTALALQKVSAGAISKLKVEETRQGYRAAQADGKVKEASLKQTQFSVASAKHSVDVAQASLKSANFNLERCTYRSPVDGQVVNWQIREGTPVARFIFTGAGTVQDFSDNSILAIFPQNRLKNVKPGNKAEIAFKRRPGQIVTGKVSEIIPYTGEGQVMPSALVPSAANIGSQGFLAVRIYLDDEQLARELPLGAAGTTAIYTEVGESFHVFTKLTVRIKAWMNYVPM